jgi:uncharacterized membrane protein YGL010W
VKRIDRLLAEYGSFHRTRGNRVCHFFGITLIVFGIFSLLQHVPLAPPGVTAAEGLLVVAFFFYLALEPALALATVGASAALDLAARAVGDWRIGLAAFALGWIFQGIGHARYERNSPAFFRNLVHLLVGPLFLVNEATGIHRREPAAGSR